MSTELILKVADMAKLELTEAEVKTFATQIPQVLEYIGQLNEVDVRSVVPMTHPTDLSTPFREDHVKPSNPKVLECAPDVTEGGFKVPQIK